MTHAIHPSTDFQLADHRLALFHHKHADLPGDDGRHIRFVTIGGKVAMPQLHADHAPEAGDGLVYGLDTRLILIILENCAGHAGRFKFGVLIARGADPQLDGLQ